MVRPTKPLALHLIQRTYRKDRHAKLLPTAPNPAPSQPEPDYPDPRRSPTEQYWAFQALPHDVQSWEGLLDLGTDFFNMLPDDLTEAQAKRKARAKWVELGPTLLRFWGLERARKSWAWRRWGAPKAVASGNGQA